MTTNSEIALAILAAFGVLALLSLMGAYIVIGMAWDTSPLRAGRGASDEAPKAETQPSGWSLTWRAAKLRCPACGRGHIFGAHFKMNQACADCGTTFWKNEGEWLGPAVVDYSMATAGALAAWALMVLAGLSEAAQLLGALIAALAGAAASSRWSRSFWTLLLYVSGELGPASHDIGKR